jgi:outer membrane protein TolC
VAVRLPIVDWGERKNRIQQAQTAADAQQERIEQTKQEIRAEVMQAITRREGAMASLAVLAKSLPVAERLLRASQIGFEEGKTAVLAVIEARRTYRTTLSEYTQAQAEVALAEIELHRVQEVVK